MYGGGDGGYGDRGAVAGTAGPIRVFFLKGKTGRLNSRYVRLACLKESADA